MQSKRQRIPAVERRELLIQGAMDVFAERGYAAASMTELARAGGITPAVVYDHFPSKAALFIACLERQSHEMMAAIGAALTADDLEQRLRDAIDAYLGYVEQHPFAWRLMFRDPPADPQIAAVHRQLDAAATEIIAQFLVRDATPATIAELPDPDHAVAMGAAMIKLSANGLVSWWYNHQDVPRKAVLDTFMAFCWTGLERLAARGEQGDPRAETRRNAAETRVGLS